MGTSPFIIRLRYGLASLLVLAVIVYVGYLLLSQYQSQSEVHRITQERFVGENDKRALATGNFLTDRMNDLANLAENRDLALYYENKALGMTAEYGLGASIAIAKNVFRSFRERKRHKDRDLFSRIVYLDASGRKMLDLHGKGQFNDGKVKWRAYLEPDQRKPHFLFEHVNQNDSIVASHPVLFKGQYVGQILAWIPLTLIYDQYFKGSAVLTALSMNNRYILIPEALQSFVPRANLPPSYLVRDNNPFRIFLPDVEGQQRHIIATYSPIEQTPFSIVTFYLDQTEVAIRQGRYVLYAMLLVGVLLLVGGVAFLRTSIRNASLKAHLEESTIRERVVSEKNESLRKLTTAIEHSPVSITITNREGTIEYVNPKFCQTTGYSADEVIGQNPRLLKGGEYTADFFREMWDIILSGKEWRGELLNRKKDGSLIWELASISPIKDESGAITHFVGVLEDISDQKQLQEELTKVAQLDKIARDKAEQASRTKSDFLASMSHEIRTPLNAIIGMSELLKESPLSDEQQNYVMIAKNAGETLLALINDILDLSKIEAGMLQLEISDFNIRSLVAQIVSVMGARSHAKDVTMTSVVNPDIPTILAGDQIRLKQILINLVGNAVKFTHKGSVDLSVVRIKADENDGVLLQFAVTDTGIGIPAEKLELIFESFSQADSSTTRRYGGTGLGLAICKRLVNIMGGEISVESVANQGSRFFFTIRLDLGTTIPITEVLPKRNLSQPQKPLSILIVDDNKDNQMIISAYFRKTAHRIDIACNGEEAVTKVLGGEEYDLILLDMEMPVMDGYTAVRLIRDWERVNGCTPLPVIALTANALVEDRQKSMDAGCTAHLTKPIHKERLMEAIERYTCPEQSKEE